MYDLPLRLYAPQKKVGSTFSFQTHLDGTKLYIDDGVKRMSFDIMLIGKTIQIEESEQLLDQSRICDDARIEIYQNTRGDNLEGARATDTLWMIGE